jgi:chemotaxis protein CheZ
MGDFNPSQIADKEIPEASDQLDAIVQTTEQATGQIMDACERLEESHKWLKDKLQNSNPPIPADTWMGVEDAINESQVNITNIYESCNFQDLTGQRINKIVEALREVERHVLRMVMVFGLQHKDVEADKRKVLEEEAQLLNGPALPGQTSLDQDDIDDILDALL